MESPAEQQLAAELIAGPGTPPRLEVVRVLGVLALLGIGASMMPPYGETAAAAPADPRPSITVRLVNADTGAGVDGATIMATCVAATSVIDDSADVAEIERIARDIIGTRLQPRAARAADDARSATCAARHRRRSRRRSWNAGSISGPNRRRRGPRPRPERRATIDRARPPSSRRAVLWVGTVFPASRPPRRRPSQPRIAATAPTQSVACPVRRVGWRRRRCRRGTSRLR